MTSTTKTVQTLTPTEAAAVLAHRAGATSHEIGLSTGMRVEYVRVAAWFARDIDTADLLTMALGR